MGHTYTSHRKGHDCWERDENKHKFVVWVKSISPDDQNNYNDGKVSMGLEQKSCLDRAILLTSNDELIECCYRTVEWRKEVTANDKTLTEA